MIFIPQVSRTLLQFLILVKKNRSLATNKSMHGFDQLILHIASHLAHKQLIAISLRRKTHAYSIHTLLCHKDISQYVIAIYSLVRYLPKIPQLIVYDDGSLSKHDISTLLSIKYLKIVPKYISDKAVTNVFSNNRILLSYRNAAVRTKKLFDVCVFKDTQKILIMDSDILFFKFPQSLINFLHDKNHTKILFLNDFQNAYSPDKATLEIIFKTNITDKVNCGLIAFSSSVLSVKFIQAYFRTLHKHYSGSYFYPWLDQSPWALLTAKYPSQRLSSEYYMNLIPPKDQIICQHYVHGSRHLMIDDLLRVVY